jgi:hypothetical protein
MHDRSALRRPRFFSRSVGRAAASRLRCHCRASLASAFKALVLAPLVFGAAAFAQRRRETWQKVGVLRPVLLPSGFNYSQNRILREQ